MTQSIPARPPYGIRALGAGIAAALAIAALGAVWTTAHAIDREGGLGLEAVLGLGGIAGGDELGRIIAWCVGPAAAAIAGWVVSPGASAYRIESGAIMGSLTYMIAIAIAPTAALPASLAQTEFGHPDPLSAVVAFPFLWLISGFLLAPLFLACVGAGIAWAGLLRIATGPPRGPSTKRPSVLGVVLLGSLLAVGWIAGFALLQSVGTWVGPGGVD